MNITIIAEGRTKQNNKKKKIKEERHGTAQEYLNT